MESGCQPVSVKDAVHKVQLYLLEGILDETQLFAAGTLMSRTDYGDVVTERSIANLCGYPLCRNSLPSERPRKGRYQISLKEHKVYDLHETYMYCSSSCVVNSRAFASTLQEDRSVLKPSKIDEILDRFEDLRLESKEDLGKDGDLGLSELKIQEKMESMDGLVSLEEWIGPPNAIEGYVPQRDHNSKPLHSKKWKDESKSNDTEPRTERTSVFNEMDFTSCIITGDEYNVSKAAPLGPMETTSTSDAKFRESEGKMSAKIAKHQLTSSFGEMDFTSCIIRDEYSISKAAPSVPVGTASICDTKLRELKGKMSAEGADHKSSMLEASSFPSQNCVKKNKESNQKRNQKIFKDEQGIKEVSQSVSSENATETKEDSHMEDVDQLCKSMLKSSLKSSGTKKQTHSVTWADEIVDCAESRNLCEIREINDKKEGSQNMEFTCTGVDGSDDRFASAEACAIALQQAADAVASGETDVTNAVSEAGIIVLPLPHDGNEGESAVDINVVEQERAPIKWPKKPGISDYDYFDDEDSWYDAPPDGFSLTLSPFATMWMAIFAWITSSSLAYIYGRDDSFHEDYLTVNGRDYPQKIILSDGRSTEIKETLAGYLSRAVPGLVSELRLRTPISTLEQTMGRLLDTMSFFDPLPSLRMKQWQVITLLFIDALSVCRIPALTPDMTSRRMLLHKVLDGAQVGVEEYEVMKDHIIPLGRVPQFSVQSGG